MTRKLFAIVLLSLTVAACDSGSTETNSNANTPAKVSVSPTPLPSPSPEPSPAVTPQLKAGDKIKVMVNGAVTNGTVVSVDETAGKATVKLEGESKERTVAISDVMKQ